MRLTGYNLRNFKDNVSGYGQSSRIRYAQNQSSRGMNARNRIFNDQGCGCKYLKFRQPSRIIYEK